MSIYATDENKKLYKISGGSGTKVTLNGQGQKEWSADFVENERQKSKNLCSLKGGVFSNGITVTFDDDAQIITLNGTVTSSDVDLFIRTRNIQPTIKNANGKTYAISLYYVSGSVSGAIRTWLGSLDSEIYGNRIKLSLLEDVKSKSVETTIVNISSNETYDTLHFYAGKGVVCNNLKLKIQMEEGNVGSDWEYPYGEIVHKNNETIKFAENEREKSKNLLVYPYTGGDRLFGVSFTDNGDGSVTINGKQNSTSSNSFLYIEESNSFKLSAGTYTLKAFTNTTVSGWNLVLYDGTYYREVSNSNVSNTFTLSEDKNCDVYIQVPKTSTTTFSNFIIRPILVKGTEVGDYQPYNGAIVHENEIDGLKGAVLWENPNPTAEFSSQTITLNSGDYEYYEVYYKYYNEFNLVLSNKSIKGYGIVLCQTNTHGNGSGAYKRDIEYVSDTSLLIKDAERAVGTIGTDIYNVVLIPLKIIGYKRS